MMATIAQFCQENMDAYARLRAATANCREKLHPKLVAETARAEAAEKELAAISNLPMKNTTDTKRLNWLEKQNACIRFDTEDDACIPQAVVFLPTIENGESAFRIAGHGDTYREAIDDAMATMIGEPST